MLEIWRDGGGGGLITLTSWELEETYIYDEWVGRKIKKLIFPGGGGYHVSEGRGWGEGYHVSGGEKGVIMYQDGGHVFFKEIVN